jgi:MFS family permease
MIVLAILAGALRGITTLLQATAVTDRWGATHYGSVNGVLSAPIMVAMAIAPWSGAALAAIIGYPALFVVLAGVGASAGGVAIGARPDTGRVDRRPQSQRQLPEAFAAVTDPSD